MQTPEPGLTTFSMPRQSAVLIGCSLMLIVGSACKLPSAGADTAKRDGGSADCSLPAPGSTYPKDCACGCAFYVCADGKWESVKDLRICTPDVRGPSCGNGIKERDETCDDGNRTPGDGCSSCCQAETNWTCPADGQPCIRLSKCGDGTVTSDEICDDGNTVGGDGCSADCRAVEPGWQCRVPGMRCSPVCTDGLAWGNDCVANPGDAGASAGGICGDGIVGPGEECDDGSDPQASSHDDDTSYGGCTTTCKSGPYCGDGVVNGAEECDLGAQNGGGYGSHGCTLACTKEHFCGDGLVDGDQGEDCDLGASNGQIGVWCDRDCRQILLQL